MSASPSREGPHASPPPKLSVSTLYPIELPKLNFYSTRAIHEDPPADRNPARQAPVTYLRYLRSKHKRRMSTRNEPALTVPALHHSMLITNSRERPDGPEAEEAWRRTRAQEEGARFSSLLEKVGAGREREEKSMVTLNYYKKKFLKYRCRKSIELEGRMEAVRKPPNRDDLLADGLKIEKIQVVEGPKVQKEIINRAKFNTLSYQGEPRRGRRWQIGPWQPHFDTQPSIAPAQQGHISWR